MKFYLFELYSLLELYELKNNIKFLNSRMQIIADRGGVYVYDCLVTPPRNGSGVLS